MPELLRLYFDEDSQRTNLARALRSRQIDVVTCNEAGLGTVDDQTQLAFAAAENRVLFTFNTKHFTRLHRDYLVGGRSHSGIIVSKQLETGTTFRRLLRLIQERSAEEMRDRIEYLGNWR
jgi:hypothetical protein